MNMRSLLPLVLLLVLTATACQQPADPPVTLTGAQWQPQPSGVSVSFRGLCAVDWNIAWASGSRGTYVRTTDGGETWISGVVPGAESLDFRDVHAIDASTAYLMSAGAGEQSRVYKTTDGGGSWMLQYQNTYPTGFFNGIAFWDDQTGIAVGDPVDGWLFIVTTTDGGMSWSRVPSGSIPPVIEGEYGFAASGTNIVVHEGGYAWIGTGGAAARVFRSTDHGRNWAVSETPIVSGAASAGIFSLAFRDARNGVAVGGDYQKPNEAGGNAATTTDGGLTWTMIKNPQSVEFRSCVAYLPNASTPTLVAVGPSGADYSVDNGETWIQFDTIGYHTMSFAGSIDAGWAAGSEGRIARFSGDVVRR